MDGYRKLEGKALARYLRWLVEASDVEIVDPLDGQRRRVRHGDVAVLAVSTWRLALLFPSLDAEGIPWASRGGTLFLADPLHRQLLLSLRALADPDDGVAEAALLRPPFFAVDLADLARERAAFAERREPDDEGGHRARAARDLVRDLRRHRLDRPPGATARDLLERTAFARAVALAPNGAERLARLRELCLVLETTTAAEGLDYDAATARLRAWRLCAQPDSATRDRYPFTRKRSPDEPKAVVIDPRISFGRPILAGSGIPTAIVAERYKAGESIDQLAEDYGRKRLDIEEAIRCEIDVEAA